MAQQYCLLFISWHGNDFEDKKKHLGINICWQMLVISFILQNDTLWYVIEKGAWRLTCLNMDTHHLWDRDMASPDPVGHHPAAPLHFR
jgi:hypothetical protein